MKVKRKCHPYNGLTDFSTELSGYILYAYII